MGNQYWERIMAKMEVLRCGDKNRAVAGRPKKIKPGCDSEMHAVQYMNEDGKPSVCHLCPRCDGLIEHG